MRDQYDFSKMKGRRNPYAARLKPKNMQPDQATLSDRPVKPTEPPSGPERKRS